MFNRIIANTSKQISRSGWAGWGSISVMTLAFLVASIFGGLAYVSNLYIQFIERKSNLLVFFEVGMDQQIISDLQLKWQQNSKIKSISYTNETDAYSLYSDYTSRIQPEIYAVLKTKEDKKLPSSLDIQVWSLEDIEEVKSLINTDIEEELKKLEIVYTDDLENAEDTQVEDSETISNENTKASDEVEEVIPVSERPKYKYTSDPDDVPIKLRVDDENLEQLREVFFWIRITGIVVISLLFAVIFFFTFMTVEFRLSNQMEEIGVMQLVGGSLFFIRAPYILEGGFYGFIGSLTSSLILGSILTSVFVVNDDSPVAVFAYKNFSKLQWPSLDVVELGGLILLISLIGFLLGAASSFLSIRRYIR